MPNAVIYSIAMHFQDDVSDKVYEVTLEDVGGKYVVNFGYARRGYPLNRGTKTPTPVSFPQARHVYDKLIDSKIDKGYQITKGGRSTYIPTVKAAPAVPTSIKPPSVSVQPHAVNASIALNLEKNAYLLRLSSEPKNRIYKFYSHHTSDVDELQIGRPNVAVFDGDRFDEFVNKTKFNFLTGKVAGRVDVALIDNSKTVLFIEDRWPNNAELESDNKYETHVAYDAFLQLVR